MAPRYRSLNDPAVSEYLDEIPKAPIPSPDQIAAASKVRYRSPRAQRLAQGVIGDTARQADAQQREAEQFARENQREQEKAAKEQAAAVEAERAMQVRAGAAAGMKTATDIPTGKTTIALHPDGEPVWTPKKLGNPIEVGTESSAIKFPGEEEPTTRPFANPLIADDGGATSAMGGTSKAIIKQPFRNDRGEPIATAPNATTDATTGREYVSRTNPATGEISKIATGIDQAKYDQVQRDRQYQARAQEIAMRDNAVKQQRFRFDPAFKPVAREMDEANKEMAALPPKFTKQGGVWKYTDPATLKEVTTYDAREVERNLKLRELAEQRHARAKEAFDRMAPTNGKLNSAEKEIATAKLKLDADKLRMDAGLPEDDGGVAKLLARAQAGETVYQDEVDAAMMEAVGIDPRMWRFDYEKDKERTGQATPRQYPERPTGQDAPHAPGTITEERPLIPSDPNKAALVTEAFQGLVNPAEFTVGHEGEGYTFIKRNGEHVGRLVTEVGEKSLKSPVLVINDNLNQTSDLRQYIAFGGTRGMDIYLGSHARPDPVKEAKWTAGVFGSLSKAQQAGAPESVIYGLLKEAGADTAGIFRKVRNGELSLQRGEAIMRDLYGTTLKADDPLESGAMERYMAEDAPAALRARYEEAKASRDTAAMNAVSKEYINNWFLENRAKPGVNLNSKLIAEKALMKDLRGGEKVANFGAAAGEMGASSAGMMATLYGLHMYQFVGDAATQGTGKAWNRLSDKAELIGRGFTNTNRSWAYNTKRWATPEGKRIYSEHEDASRKLKISILAQDAYEDGVEDPRFQSEFSQLVDATIDSAMDLHTMGLFGSDGREEGWEITRKDLEKLNWMPAAAAISGDMDLLEQWRQLLLQDHGTRQAEAMTASLTSGQNRYLAAFTAGSVAPPQEIIVEAASWALNAGVGKVVYGGAKSAQIAAKAAEAGATASRIQKMRGLAAGVVEGLKTAGMKTGTLAAPLGTGAKFSNQIVKGAKVMAAGAVTNAPQEAVMAIADRNATAQSVMHDFIAGGAFGAVMPIVGAPLIPLSNMRQNAARQTAARKYADLYNRTNRDTPDFVPLSPENAETAMALLPDDTRKTLIENRAAAQQKLIRATELAEKYPNNSSAQNNHSRAIAEAMEASDQIALAAARQVEAVKAVESLPEAERPRARAILKVASGRADLLTAAERATVAGATTATGNPYFANVNGVEYLTAEARAELATNASPIAGIVRTDESQALTDAAFEAAQPISQPGQAADASGAQGDPATGGVVPPHVSDAAQPAGLGSQSPAPTGTPTGSLPDGNASPEGNGGSAPLSRNARLAGMEKLGYDAAKAVLIDIPSEADVVSAAIAESAPVHVSMAKAAGIDMAAHGYVKGAETWTRPAAAPAPTAAKPAAPAQTPTNSQGTNQVPALEKRGAAVKEAAAKALKKGANIVFAKNRKEANTKYGINLRKKTNPRIATAYRKADGTTGIILFPAALRLSDAKLKALIEHETIHLEQYAFEATPEGKKLAAEAEGTFIPGHENYDQAFDRYMAKEYPGWDKLSNRSKLREATRAAIEGLENGETSHFKKGFFSYLKGFLAHVSKVFASDSAISSYIKGLQGTLEEQEAAESVIISTPPEMMTGSLPNGQAPPAGNGGSAPISQNARLAGMEKLGYDAAKAVLIDIPSEADVVSAAIAESAPVHVSMAKAAGIDMAAQGYVKTKDVWMRPGAKPLQNQGSDTGNAPQGQTPGPVDQTPAAIAARIQATVETAIPGMKGRVSIVNNAKDGDGRVMPTGGAFANPDGTVALSLDDIAREMQGRDPAALEQSILDIVLRHEIVHVVQYQAVQRMWVESGGKGDFPTFFRQWYGQIAKELGADAMATAREIYGAEAWDAQPVENQAAELVRMLVEARLNPDQAERFTELSRQINFNESPTLIATLKAAVDMLIEMVKTGKLPETARVHVEELAAMYEELVAGKAQETLKDSAEIKENAGNLKNDAEQAPAEPTLMQLLGQAFTRAIVANPEIVARRLELFDLLDELSDALEGLPPAQIEAELDRQLGEWIAAQKETQEAQQAALDEAKSDEKSQKARAARLERESKITAKADKLLAGTRWLGELVRQGIRIELPPNIISLMLARKRKGQRLTQNEIDTLRAYTGGEYDGLPRQSMFPGGGRNALMRNIIARITAPNGSPLGVEPDKAAQALEEPFGQKITVDDFLQEIDRELRALSRGESLADSRSPDFEGDEESIAKADAAARAAMEAEEAENAPEAAPEPPQAAPLPSLPEVIASLRETYGEDMDLAKKLEIAQAIIAKLPEPIQTAITYAAIEEEQRIAYGVISAAKWQEMNPGLNDAARWFQQLLDNHTPGTIRATLNNLRKPENQQVVLERMALGSSPTSRGAFASIAPILENQLSKPPSQYQYETTNESSTETRDTLDFLGDVQKTRIDEVTSSELSAQLREVERATGATIRFFKSSSEITVAGFTPLSRPDLIFINADRADMPLSAIIAHELTHIAQKDSRANARLVFREILDKLSEAEFVTIENALMDEGYPSDSLEAEIPAFVVADAISGHNTIGLPFYLRGEELRANLKKWFYSLPTLKPDAKPGARFADFSQGSFDFGATGEMGTKNQLGFNFDGPRAKAKENAQAAFDKAPEGSPARARIATQIAKTEGLADPALFVKQATQQPAFGFNDTTAATRDQLGLFSSPSQRAFDFGASGSFNTRNQAGFDFSAPQDTAKPANPPQEKEKTAIQWMFAMRSGQFESANEWARNVPPELAMEIVDIAVEELNELDKQLEPNTGKKASPRQIDLLNQRRPYQTVITLLNFEHGETIERMRREKAAANPPQAPATLGSSPTPQAVRSYLGGNGTPADVLEEESQRIADALSVQDRGQSYAQGDLFGAATPAPAKTSVAEAGKRAAASAKASKTAISEDLRRGISGDWEALGREVKAKGRASSILADLINREIPHWNVNGTIIESPEDVHALMLPIRSPYFESLKVMVLDGNNMVSHSQILTVGNLNSTTADVAEIFAVIARLRETSGKRHNRLIFSHNHPSGNPQPSPDDVRVTTRLSEIAKVAGWDVIDHIITDGEKFYSFRENGIVGGGTLNENTFKPRNKQGTPAPKITPEDRTAEWEVTPRSKLRQVDSPEKLGDVARHLRNANPDAAHILYTNTYMQLTAVERIDIKDAMDDQAMMRIILAARGREGAYGFALDVPERFNTRDFNLKIARLAQLTNIKHLDTVSLRANGMDPWSARAAGIVGEEAPMRLASSPSQQPEAPIIVALQEQIAYQERVFGEITPDRITKAVQDAAWKLMGDKFSPQRQDAMQFLTGKRHSKADSSVTKLAEALGRWVKNNGTGSTTQKEPTRPFQETIQPDLFTAASAPDAREKLGDVKVGRMNALGAYRALTAKRDKVGLTATEEQQLLDAEVALGQKLAFDMEGLKGAAPASDKDSLTVATPPPAALGGSLGGQSEMMMDGETERGGQMRLFSAPSPELLRRPHFHATSSEEAGKSILADGIIKPPMLNGKKGKLVPVEGRVYMSGQRETAAIYSLGGVMMGHKYDWQSRSGRSAGQYGYIFEIDPASLRDVQPDEDSIGELVYKSFRNLSRPDVDYPLWLRRMADRHATPTQIRNIKEGMYADFAALGKKLVKLMSDEQKLALIDGYGAHVAAEGQLRFIRAWRVDKAKSERIDKDGMNLFDVAELVHGDKPMRLFSSPTTGGRYAARRPENPFAYTYRTEYQGGELKHIVRAYNQDTFTKEDRVFDTRKEAQAEMDRLDDDASEVAPDQIAKLLGLASSPSADNQAALDMALNSMRPIYRAVWEDIQSGKTPEQITQARGLGSRAVTNILDQIRARTQAALQAASKDGLKPAMRDGKFDGGRPDLALSTIPEVAAIDQMRNDSGVPDVRPWAEVLAEAEQELAADYQGTYDRMLGLARDMKQMTDKEVAMSKMIIARETKGGNTDNPAERVKLAMLIHGYRDIGTETARSLAIRRDPHKSPADRHAQFIAEALFSPDDKTAARLRKATPGQQENILAEWMRRVDAIKAELKASGLDIDASLAAHNAREQAKRQAAEENPRAAAVIEESFRKLTRIERTVVEAIRSGSTYEGAAFLVGMDKQDAKDIYAAWVGGVREAMKESAKRYLSTTLASSPMESAMSSIMEELGIPDPDLVPLDEADRPRVDAEKEARKPRKPKTPKPATETKTKAEKMLGVGDKPLTDKQKAAIERFVNAEPSTWKVIRQETGKLFPQSEGFPADYAEGENARRILSGLLLPDPINEEAGTWDETRPFLGQGELLRDPINETTGTFDMNDPIALMRVAEAFSVARGTTMDKVMEFWRMSILTGLQTHLVNTGSNALNAAYNLLPRRAVEAGTNTLLSALGLGTPQGATFSEFSAMMKHARAAAQLGARQLMRSWKAENRIFDAYAEGSAYQVDFMGVGNEQFAPKLGGKLGKLMRSLSFRAMTAADEGMKHFYGTLEAAAQAHRIAKSEEKLTGAAYESRVKALMQPGSKAWVRASDEAKRITFQTELDGTNPRLIARIDQLAELAKKGRAMPWIGRPLTFFLPFIDTPTNIVKEAIEMSPIGGALAVIDGTRALRRRYMRGKMSQDQAEAEIAKLYDRARFVRDVTNQTIAWTAYFAIAGLLEPDDDDEDGRPFITGTQPYKTTKRGERDNAYAVMPAQSLRIGDTVFSYSRVEPFASMLAGVADLIQEINRNDGKLNGAAASAYAMRLKDQFKDKTFLQGVSDLINAIEDPSRFLESTTSNIVTGFVPNIIRQPIREMDSNIRDTRPREGEGVLQAIARRVGYSVVPQAAPVKMDVWGNEIKANRGDDLFGSPVADAIKRAIDPFNSSTGANADPIDAWIYRFNAVTADSADRIGIQALPDYVMATVDGKRVKLALTPEEQAEANRNAGKAARAALGDDWDWKGAESADAPAKADFIVETVKAAQSAERERLRQMKLAEIQAAE